MIVEPFAGGLGPENLAAQLGGLEHHVGDAAIWINLESRVRSDDSRQLDLGKVRKCLEIAEPYAK